LGDILLPGELTLLGLERSLPLLGLATRSLVGDPPPPLLLDSLPGIFPASDPIPP